MASIEEEKSRPKRERKAVDYAAIQEGQAIPMTSDFYFMNDDEDKSWGPLTRQGRFDLYRIRQMPGSALTLEWCRKDGLFDPLLVPSKEGLGLTVPPPSFSVRDVAHIIGPNTPLNVMDCSTQEILPGWTLGKWADYYEASPGVRKELRGGKVGSGSALNVISLEFSRTNLSSRVRSPSVVRHLDLVDNSWPLGGAERSQGVFPQAQYYCLMSVAGCFTDFHIDFGGTSVWYHVLRGRKVFLLVPPSEANLAAYTKWSSSATQADTFFGDLAERCFKVSVEAGQTLIIPCGWIHAVLTPIDSLVFGGNFLTAMAMEGQLKCHAIEKQLKIKDKFCFPYFKRALWYAVAHALKLLRAAHHGAMVGVGGVDIDGGEGGDDGLLLLEEEEQHRRKSEEGGDGDDEEEAGNGGDKATDGDGGGSGGEKQQQKKKKKVRREDKEEGGGGGGVVPAALSRFECEGYTALVSACRAWLDQSSTFSSSGDNGNDNGGGRNFDPVAMLAASMCGHANDGGGRVGGVDGNGPAWAMLDELEKRVKWQRKRVEDEEAAEAARAAREGPARTAAAAAEQGALSEGQTTSSFPSSISTSSLLSSSSGKINIRLKKTTPQVTVGDSAVVVPFENRTAAGTTSSAATSAAMITTAVAAPPPPTVMTKLKLTLKRTAPPPSNPPLETTTTTATPAPTTLVPPTDITASSSTSSSSITSSSTSSTPAAEEPPSTELPPPSEPTATMTPSIGEFDTVAAETTATTSSRAASSTETTTPAAPTTVAEAAAAAEMEAEAEAEAAITSPVTAVAAAAASTSSIPTPSSTPPPPPPLSSSAQSLPPPSPSSRGLKLKLVLPSKKRDSQQQQQQEMVAEENATIPKEEGGDGGELTPRAATSTGLTLKLRRATTTTELGGREEKVKEEDGNEEDLDDFDVACCVAGCEAVDLKQRSLPHWKRQVSGALSSSVVATNAANGFRDVPISWSLVDEGGSGLTPAQREKHLALKGRALYPICSKHAAEQAEWRRQGGAPLRFSSQMNLMRRDSSNTGLGTTTTAAAAEAPESAVASRLLHRQAQASVLGRPPRTGIEASSSSSSSTSTISSGGRKRNDDEDAYVDDGDGEWGGAPASKKRKAPGGLMLSPQNKALVASRSKAPPPAAKKMSLKDLIRQKAKAARR